MICARIAAEKAEYLCAKKGMVRVDMSDCSVCGKGDKLISLDIKLSELRKQNAALAEENLAAHLVNKEFADEVRELKQQLAEADAGIESISQHYREWVDGLEKEVAELREELDSANACNTALWTLAEERRVALAKCSPFAEDSNCVFCRKYRSHYNECVYFSITKTLGIRE